MALSLRTKSYFRSQAALVGTRSSWDCLAASEALASLLLHDGRSPLIGRLRKIEVLGGTVFHAPLIPKRFAGELAWTTHYVCIDRGIVYDPVALQPLRFGSYTRSVFDEELSIETFVAQAELEKYLAARSPNPGRALSTQ